MDGNFTYVVRCADGSLYCGWTNHLKERICAHNEGRGAKYTKSRRPVELVYFETFPTKQDAMRREWQIKHMTRAKKLELIVAFSSRQADGSCESCGSWGKPGDDIQIRLADSDRL